MNISGMLEDLNREIARLTQIRHLPGETAVPKPGPGRTKGSGKKTATSSSSESALQRRVLSEEAREKIAAAQRKRWAAGKKVSKSAPKPGVVKTIRATPPMAKKASGKAIPAKKAPQKSIPAKKATAGKGASTKKTVKAPVVEKRPT